MCCFQTNYPYYCGFLCIFFGLLDQFGWQSLFPVAISEAGYPKVAAKISNWLETRSHRSHLSRALLLICTIDFFYMFCLGVFQYIRDILQVAVPIAGGGKHTKSCVVPHFPLIVHSRNNLPKQLDYLDENCPSYRPNQILDSPI